MISVKKVPFFVFFVAALAGMIMSWNVPSTMAAFNAGNIIDDTTFQNSTAMTAGQIDTFLNGFPGSCISTNNGFTTPDPQGFSDAQNKYTFGGPVSGGQAIYDTAQIYHVNPRVILTTLQKEQSIVTGSHGCHTDRPNPSDSSQLYTCTIGGTVYTNGCTDACPTAYGGGCMNIAMSYGCPGSCKAADEGFSLQLTLGTWILRFAQQRAYGTLTGYVGHETGDENFCYSGPMTAGNRQRSASTNPCPSSNSPPGNTVISYDGTYTPGDSSTITIANGSTASLYNYTPFVSGNQSFYNTWNTFNFGSLQLAINSIVMTQTQPNLTPALGETVTYSVTLTNNSTDSVTLDAVGVVGRLGNVSTGANRDFNSWQGPVTIAGSGGTYTHSYTLLVQDLGTIYTWPSIFYQGSYYHYNNWGAMMVTHVPNIGAAFSPGTSPTVGQTDNFSVNVFNNESHSITLDAAGIPIRYLNRYNYDTGWTGPVTIAAHSTIASPLTGSITYDKAGAYTEWTSIKIGNQYITISPTANVNASLPSPSPSNILLSYTVTPNTSPSLGEDVTLSFKLTSTYSVPITLDAIGVVGRYDSPFTGANRDLGWAGPITIAANGNYQKSYTTTVSDLRNFYTWVAINYQGRYIHYNNWGFMLTPHIPNLVLSVPITGQPTLNQSTPMNATIQSHEPNAIKYDAAGMPARYYDRYNYDITWAPGGTLNNNGTIALSGNALFDKPGPYTVWVSILIQGRFITIGSVKSFNIQ